MKPWNNKKIWKQINKSKPNTNTEIKFDKIIDEIYNDTNVLISVNNLEMKYKTFLHGYKTIFQNVNFNIYENKVLALVGPNGCGKTTIVEIIARLKQQTNGNIKYNYKINNNDLNIGVQFQDLSFPKGLTVKDLLLFQFKIMNITKIDFSEIEKILVIFRLNNLLYTKISKLSGGQQQRLNVLLAIISKPKILFLDEFTTGLDIAIKNQIKNFILEYAKTNNITIIIISHDIETISEMADYFVLIANKSIVVNTTKQKILEKYNSISSFLFDYIK